MTGFVRTRGGLLVGLVVLTVIGFEVRTVVGMVFGIDLPAAPYTLGMIAVVAIVGLWLEVQRDSPDSAAES